MNIFFYSNIEYTNNAIGITKKVKGQVSALRSLGNNVLYSCYYDNRFAVMDNNDHICAYKNNIFSKTRLNHASRRFGLISFVTDYIKHHTFDIVYMRYHYFDKYTLNLIKAAKRAGAKVIMQTNPIALALLKNAREVDADICVAEGQPLGMPLSFGGPYLGIMTCKKELMRKLPGRIVGQTKDRNGDRCYVLTLQAREQHIRREKASSNICSNEALCAMTASVYCAAMGPEGLRQVAVNSASNAHYLAFLMKCPRDCRQIIDQLAERGYLGGLPINNNILWCCTELNSKAEIDEMVKIIREAL